MALDYRQWAELDAALRSAYNDYDDFKRVIYHNTGYKLEDYVADTRPFPAVVESIMNAAQQDGWTYDLVRAALVGRPSNQLLINFISNYPTFDPANPPPPPPNYYDAYFVHARYLFIGRKKLREKLRLLREVKYTSRILLVAGKRVSGKTYTRELINFLASVGIAGRPETHKQIYIDLDKFTYQPFDIVKDIAQRMGLDANEIATIPIQNEEQKARYIHYLCLWLQNQIARTANTIWWFVFDGFRINELLPETKDMIAALSEQVEKELTEKCYVVLLNYNEKILPLVLAQNAEREDVELIQDAELNEFFNQLFIDNGKNYAADDIKKIVGEINRQIDEKIASGSNIEERLLIQTMAVNKAVKLLQQSNYAL